MSFHIEIREKNLHAQKELYKVTVISKGDPEHTYYFLGLMKTDRLK